MQKSPLSMAKLLILCCVIVSVLAISACSPASGDPDTDTTAGAVTPETADPIAEGSEAPSTEPGTEPGTEPATEPVPENIPELTEDEAWEVVSNNYSTILYYRFRPEDFDYWTGNEDAYPFDGWGDGTMLYCYHDPDINTREALRTALSKWYTLTYIDAYFMNEGYESSFGLVMHNGDWGEANGTIYFMPNYGKGGLYALRDSMTMEQLSTGVYLISVEYMEIGAGYKDFFTISYEDGDYKFGMAKAPAVLGQWSTVKQDGAQTTLVTYSFSAAGTYECRTKIYGSGDENKDGYGWYSMPKGIPNASGTYFLDGDVLTLNYFPDSYYNKETGTLTLTVLELSDKLVLDDEFGSYSRDKKAVLQQLTQLLG